MIGFQSNKNTLVKSTKKGQVLITSVFLVKSLSNIILFKTLVPLRQHLLLFFHNSKIMALVAIILPCILKRWQKCSNTRLTSAKHFIDAALKRYTDQMHEEASRGKQWQSTSLQKPPAVNHRRVNFHDDWPWLPSSTTTLLWPGRGWHVPNLPQWYYELGTTSPCPTLNGSSVRSRHWIKSN